MTRMEDKYSQVMLATLLLVFLVIGGYIVNAAPTITAKIYNTGQISTTTVYAKSGYWRDIQAAVDAVAAAGGGIVYIPEGVWNFVNVGESWTGARVVVPPGVSIFGAATRRTSGLSFEGIGQNPNDQVVEWRTVLVMPWDVPGTWESMPAWFMLGGNPSNYARKSIRFSDIKLIGYRSINSSSTTQHVGLLIVGVLDFRVDHCFFEHICGGAIAIPPYYDWNFYCSGVIDHCYFVNIHGYDNLANYKNGNIGYGIRVSRSYWAPGGQSMPYDPKENMLGQYTDHSVFIEDCYFSKWRHCVASGHGGYYVFRYNTIENDFGHFSLDVHGLRDTETGYAGGQGCEIYHNKFVNAVSTDFRTIFQNGGGYGVWFNNYVDTSYRSDGIVLYNEDAVPSETWHLKDFYLWSKLGPWTPSWDGIPSGFSEDRNVYADWNRPAYNPSDPRYPNVNPSWSIAGYKPYAYPHPLTTK